MMKDYICAVECEDGMKSVTISANEYADRFDLEWMAWIKLSEEGEIPLIDGKFSCRPKTIWDTLGDELAYIEKCFDELCDQNRTVVSASRFDLFSRVCSCESVRFTLFDARQNKRGKVTHYILDLA